MFVLDIETLGTESNAVVLSAALAYFEPETPFTFNSLVESSCFVKFDLDEQKDKYKRTIERSTVDWWKNQSKEAQKMSLFRSSSDLSAREGIEILRDYIATNKTKKSDICWIRGTLDQVCIDSLCKDLKVPFLFNYYEYRDVRTALDLTKETSQRGYCKIDGFDKSVVNKHDPVHDVCYDAMQLVYGV